jgi:hypothetical protein
MIWLAQEVYRVGDLSLGRNYLWALRQIGKRSVWLNRAARETAQERLSQEGRSTWVASDALRELTSEKVQAKLK